MSKKKLLTAEQKAECQAAQSLFLSKKNEMRLSQKKVADLIGISPAAIAMYLNGTNALNARFAAAFAAVIGEPVESFSPRLAMEIAKMAQAAVIQEPEEAEPEYPRTPHEDDYALIPQYTAKGSCGAGFLNGHVEVKGSLAFKREWLAKMKAKPENLRVMYAHGESMEPYIFEGEVVLFDVSEKEPRDKKVFVIRRPDGDISIKRLAQRLDGTWVVSSDNPDKTRFRDETYLPDALHEIPIVGRVIWRGGEVD